MGSVSEPEVHSSPGLGSVYLCPKLGLQMLLSYLPFSVGAGSQTGCHTSVASPLSVPGLTCLDRRVCP